MANDMQKEEWINAVINSAQGMPRAIPSAQLAGKIMMGLNAPVNPRIIVIPVKQWAAAAILLLALNIGSVVYFTSQSKHANTGNENSNALSELQTATTYNY